MQTPSASIGALIDARAEQHGERIVLIEPDGATLDYATLRERVKGVAGLLTARGLVPGDSVAYAMNNGIEAVLAILGIQYAGLRAVAVNLVAGRDVIGYVLAHSGARSVIVQHGTRDAIAEALDCEAYREAARGDAPTLLDLEAAAGAARDACAVAMSNGDSDALLMYTSGTTGRPKGVRLSHANLLAGGRNTVSGHGLGESDRALCTLPLYHINGLCVTLYGPLVSGGSVVLPTRFSASRFWSWAERCGCTWFSVVPTQVGYLLHDDAEAQAHRTTASRLRFGRSASAPLSPDVHQAFEQRFGLPLIETMGLTETAAQVTTNPMPPEAVRIGSAGRAHGCELRIVTSTSQNAIGEEGEIQIRGENVMQGYLDNEVATREAFSTDGWLRTGDLGRLDADGFVFVTGRLKELIIKGGENIAPREIDEALHAHPDVLEAAAFGVPCTDYGERVEAAVVAVPGRSLDLDALLMLCEQRLGRFKRPDRLHLVEELPKGPSGKIQRRRCAERFAAEPAPDAV